jgi:cysteine-rich repeat protein
MSNVLAMDWRTLLYNSIYVFVLMATLPLVSLAQTYVATTTLTLSICGNGIVDPSEACDAPSETGAYSTTILGRQCRIDCRFGPYCGDGILQAQFGEECDDGNNDNGDFCSAECKIEPAGSGGGGSSGGGSSSGGSSQQQGETQISVVGRGYPGRPINILLDGRAVGTVQADTQGRFEFSTPSEPGTVTMGFWSTDNQNTRSITFNNTFDVTQGAITNINSVLLPPTLRLSSAQIDPGAPLTISGQAIPNARMEIHFAGGRNIIATTTAGTSGAWSLTYNTAGLPAAAYTVKARYISGVSPLLTQSNFSTVVQLFLGVEGSASTPSDLNRDGRVNLIDFSILLFWWQTDGGTSDPPADINGNGRVSLEDFSILLFNWTG